MGPLSREERALREKLRKAETNGPERVFPEPR